MGILVVMIFFLMGCSVKKMAMRQVGDALAGTGSTFSSENDPELVREALPFSLKLMEGLPYITGRSLEELGSVSDGIFNAQKGLFGGLAKGMGDARAEDRTGRLLRRVEMVNCGLL